MDSNSGKLSWDWSALKEDDASKQTPASAGRSQITATSTTKNADVSLATTNTSTINAQAEDAGASTTDTTQAEPMEIDQETVEDRRGDDKLDGTQRSDEDDDRILWTSYVTLEHRKQLGDRLIHDGLESLGLYHSEEDTVVAMLRQCGNYQIVLQTAMRQLEQAMTATCSTYKTAIWRIGELLEFPDMINIPDYLRKMTIETLVNDLGPECDRHDMKYISTQLVVAAWTEVADVASGTQAPLMEAYAVVNSVLARHSPRLAAWGALSEELLKPAVEDAIQVEDTVFYRVGRMAGEFRQGLRALDTALQAFDSTQETGHFIEAAVRRAKVAAKGSVLLEVEAMAERSQFTKYMIRATLDDQDRNMQTKNGSRLAMFRTAFAVLTYEHTHSLWLAHVSVMHLRYELKDILITKVDPGVEREPIRPPAILRHPVGLVLPSSIPRQPPEAVVDYEERYRKAQRPGKDAAYGETM